MIRTILITGANKGIGLETARQLARRGFHVIMAGRNPGALDAALQQLRAEGASASSVIIDVSREDSIQAAARELLQQGISLDVLINNAAVLLKTDQSLSTQSADLLAETLQTNCFGALNMVRHFLPLMKTPGRIINVSSGGGSMTDPVGGWSPAYCVSKSLLNAMTRHLAHELAGRGIAVNAVCPGWVKTDMGGAGAVRPVEKGAETPVWLACEADQRLSGKFFRDKREIAW
jgi:NAD(P)-dependent dehydrogenase (short-subunit alcohol dehydrogenase family)